MTLRTMKNTQKQERRCRYCGKVLRGEAADIATNPSFPFCSKRCRMADLDKWFGEAYYISQEVEELTAEQREEIARGDIPAESEESGEEERDAWD